MVGVRPVALGRGGPHSAIAGWLTVVVGTLRELISRLLVALDGLTPGQKGLALLCAGLTPAQLKQYQQHRHFDVVGGSTSRRYRIHRGTSMNIDELDESGEVVRKWCFFPEGGLVTGDVMLAQKLALELFEQEALAVAHKFQRRTGFNSNQPPLAYWTMCAANSVDGIRRPERRI